MTNHSTPAASPASIGEEHTGLQSLDLSPQGLADAPAHQEDPDSLVYAGNS